MGICAYKHTSVENKDAEQSNLFEHELKVLRSENKDLKNKLKAAEIALGETIDQLKSDIR